MPKKLDLIDLKILEELKKNSRISFSDISERIDKTEATVRRRVKKLIEEGIITRFTIQYDIDTTQNISATIKAVPDRAHVLLQLERIPTIKERKKLEAKGIKLL
ncbi:MAG: Lrp/AsnC family transcriptional regulator, partial [Promethearchaeota archaeon]